MKTLLHIIVIVVFTDPSYYYSSTSHVDRTLHQGVYLVWIDSPP